MQARSDTKRASVAGEKGVERWSESRTERGRGRRRSRTVVKSEEASRDGLEVAKIVQVEEAPD